MHEYLIQQQQQKSIKSQLNVDWISIRFHRICYIIRFMEAILYIFFLSLTLSLPFSHR